MTTMATTLLVFHLRGVKHVSKTIGIIACASRLRNILAAIICGYADLGVLGANTIRARSFINRFARPP